MVLGWVEGEQGDTYVNSHVSGETVCTACFRMKEVRVAGAGQGSVCCPDRTRTSPGRAQAASHRDLESESQGENSDHRADPTADTP